MNSDIIIRNATKDDAMDIAGIIVEDWQIAYKNIIDDDNLRHPLLSKEAKETMDEMMYAPQDPEGRSFKNLYQY
ncbi:MAG: hypothetical protein J6W58_06020, partial [Lachnospiraceae bacterium]|nr:hypothetical protein [Lachnospiraceae bacterium]